MGLYGLFLIDTRCQGRWLQTMKPALFKGKRLRQGEVERLKEGKVTSSYGEEMSDKSLFVGLGVFENSPSGKARPLSGVARSGGCGHTRVQSL